MSNLETSTHLAELLKQILPTIDMAAITVSGEDLDGILNDMRDNLSRMQSVQVLTMQSNESVGFESAKVELFESFVNMVKARQKANKAFKDKQRGEANLREIRSAFGI